MRTIKLIKKVAFGLLLAMSSSAGYASSSVLPVSPAGKSFTLLPKIVCDDRGTDMDFPIVDMEGKAAAIICDETDFKGVRRAVADLAEDISRVCGVKPRQPDRLSMVLDG